MSLLMVPTYQVGYARNAAESAWPQLWNSLVFSWCPLLGCTGNRSIDQSFYGNHGTWNGTGEHWKASGGWGGAGLAGQFNGSDDYIIKSGFSPTLHGLAAVSMACWFRTSTQMTNRYLVSVPQVSSGSNGVDLGFTDSNTVRAIVVRGGGDISAEYDVAYDDGNWHHIALTYSKDIDGKVHLYWDGQDVAQSDAWFTNITAASNELNIGRFGSIGNYSTALIDDVRIYTRATTPGEIWLLSRRRGIAYELAETMQTAEIVTTPLVIFPYTSSNIFRSFIRSIA